jgi:hypothetical protein
MALPIIIPNPCHESWQDMTPENKGRHCAACDKIVVDFSNWEAEEILQYLKTNTGACGRFTKEQIQDLDVFLTENALSAIAHTTWHRWYKFAAAVICMFVLSSTFTVGTMAQEKSKTPALQNTPSATMGKPMIMGEYSVQADTMRQQDIKIKPSVDSLGFAPKVSDFKDAEQRNKKAVQLGKENMIMGIIAFPPPKR